MKPYWHSDPFLLLDFQDLAYVTYIQGKFQGGRTARQQKALER